MESFVISSNCLLSLHRIRSSSSFSNKSRSNSIKISTYKCHGNSMTLSKSLTWRTNFHTRTKYMGAILASQGNDVQPSADNNNAGPPPGKSWINWLVGVALSLVMPFLSDNWKRLLAIKNEVCRVADTVETVAETVEKVAEEVADVADEIANSLPEGGTMQNIACNIANVAEQTAKDAHSIDQFIDKVEDVEKKIVSSMTTHEVEANLRAVPKDNNIKIGQEVEHKHDIVVDEVPQNEIINESK